MKHAVYNAYGMKVFSFLILLVLCSSCISMYYRYEKIPCTDLGVDPKKDIQRVILSTGFKERDVVVTDKSAQYERRTVEYNEISKVVVITKKMLKGKRYTLLVVMKNRDKHNFRTYDYKLALSAYSTLECLAGIKPQGQAAPLAKPDKYEKLAKLKSLLDSGALTQEEFEKEKAKILTEE